MQPAAPTLVASNISAFGATLTISNHIDDWWYKGSQSGATCTSVGAGTSMANLSGLDASTSYTYKAYSDNSCTTELATETFSTNSTPSFGSSTIADRVHIQKRSDHIGKPSPRRPAATPR